jgi:hypothetical protein
MSENSADRGNTASVAEVRQMLETAKAHYKGKDSQAFDKAIDNVAASLTEKFGEAVPFVDVIKALRNLPLHSGETAATVAPAKAPSEAAASAGSAWDRTPDGVRFEWTPGGFLLRASCRSTVGAVLRVGFAGLLAVLPFRLWGDLIRGLPTDQGMSFWLTGAFLAIWAGAILYIVATAAFELLGEIRIAKTGDRGEIFTGIGTLGWTHRLRWRDFDGVSDRAVAAVSSGKFSNTTHSVSLNATLKPYRFGSALTAQQREFAIAFLRQHVFASAPKAT